MRLVRYVACISLVVFATSSVHAQWGSYGAPETLRLPAAQPMPLGQPVAASYEAPQTIALSGNAPAANAPAGSAPACVSQPGMYGASQYDPPVPPPLPQPGMQSLPPTSGAMPGPVSGPAGYTDPNASAVPQLGCYGNPTAPGPVGPGSGAGQGCLDGAQDAGPWYVSIMALEMTRNQGNKLWTSAQNNAFQNQVMNTNDIPQSWEAGGQITFGRTFCCNQWSLEATYWTLVPFDGSASVGSQQGDPLLRSPLTNGYTMIGANGLNNWFDNSPLHTIWRHDEVHDLELNLIRNHLCGDDCGPFNIDTSAGVRYFRFRDRLIFGAVEENWSGPQYTPWQADSHSAYLNEDIANNLVGLQMGLNASWRFAPGWRLFVTPQIGLYDNILTSDFNAYLGDGTQATQNLYPGSSYPVHSTRNGFSVLTQVDVGLDWQFSCHWSARLGYRLVAATGMGMAEDQIPQITADMPALADIQHSSTLIMHGAFTGLTYRF